MRPVVSVALVGAEVSNPAYALVDSGSSHVLAAPHLADAIGVDPRSSNRSLVLGMGGDNIRVRFVDVRVRLLAPSGDEDDYIEWEDEVGSVTTWRPTWPVLLGQYAFMKRFTVTMSRHAQALAVEDLETFDSRFGVQTMRG